MFLNISQAKHKNKIKIEMLSFVTCSVLFVWTLLLMSFCTQPISKMSVFKASTFIHSSRCVFIHSLIIDSFAASPKQVFSYNPNLSYSFFLHILLAPQCLKLQNKFNIMKYSTLNMRINEKYNPKIADHSEPVKPTVILSLKDVKSVSFKKPLNLGNHLSSLELQEIIS